MHTDLPNALGMYSGCHERAKSKMTQVLHRIKSQNRSNAQVKNVTNFARNKLKELNFDTVKVSWSITAITRQSDSWLKKLESATINQALTIDLKQNCEYSSYY